MPEVTELLERLADRPPCDPTPIADIRALARRRQRRRQRVTVGGLGLCLVIAAVVVTSGSNPDDVRTGATTTEPTLAASNGLDISPGADLRDGQEVTLSLPSDPGGEVRVTQCAAEFVGIADDPSANWWCGGVYSLRSPAGPPDLVVRVARRLETPNGTVDCASVPGRCLLFAGANGPGTRRDTFDTRRVAPSSSPTTWVHCPKGSCASSTSTAPLPTARRSGSRARATGRGRRSPLRSASKRRSRRPATSPARPSYRPTRTGRLPSTSSCSTTSPWPRTPSTPWTGAGASPAS